MLLLKDMCWSIHNLKFNQLKTICAVALEESDKAVLEAWKKLLLSEHTMNLWFGIWLAVNLWLRWNKTTHRVHKRIF